MRILLSAYACCPHKGSEPGVGWHWATGLAGKHEVHVLTADWSRPAIATYLATIPIPGLHFHYIPDLLPNTSLWPLGLGWLHYYLWQWRAFLKAKNLHTRHAFDLAHAVSYNTWRAPCFLWKLKIPFVFGPVGGGQSSPRELTSILGFSGICRENVRNLCQVLSAWDPMVKATLRNAATVLAANQATSIFLRTLGVSRLESMLETAVEVPPQAPVKENKQDSPSECRLLWAGHMEPRKALGLALHAVSLLPAESNIHLDIAGDGPERRRWEIQARKLGVSDKVTFLGAIPRSLLLGKYRECDIFVFTSIRETSGNVLLEAMAAARPIICLDCPGPKDVTNPKCARLIKPAPPERVAHDISSAIIELAEAPDLRRSMGLAGYEHVRSNFTWPEKLQAIEECYSEALKTYSHQS